MTYVFIHSIEKYDDFVNDVIYIDIETVENINDVENLDKHVTLNVNNAKYVAVASFRELVYDKERFNTFTHEKRDDVYLYYNTVNIDVETIRDFILDLASRNNIKTFIAFNGLRFDFLIFKNMRIVEFNRCIATLYANKKRYRLVDIICLAKALGKNTLSEFVKLSSHEKVLLDNIVEYCKNDVYALAKTCKTFQNVYNYTPTRTSRFFLREYMKNKKIITDTDVYLNTMDYIGGRVSVFRYEVDNNIYHYDFNSLYPFVMSKMKLPLLYETDKVFKIYVDECSHDDAERFINLVTSVYDERRNIYHTLEILNNLMRVYLFMRVKILRVKNDYSVFAFSYKNEKKQRLFHFEPGREYWIYGYEIAFLKFYEYEIIECYYTQASFLDFRDKIDELYKKRLEYKKKHDSRELLYKLVLNSIYGVFGKRDDVKKYMHMNEDIEKIKKLAREHNIELNFYEINTFDDIIDGKHVEFVKGIYNVLRISYIDRKFSKISAPPLALAITSNARFMLNSLIYHLRSFNKDVYYCDTDSVFTNASTEFMRLYLSDMLGRLKHEGTYRKAIFLANKTYVTIDDNDVKMKMKGTGKELEREIVMQSFKTDLKIITRKFIDIESVPPFLPQNNIPVYNASKTKIKDHDEYMRLIDKYVSLIEKKAVSV